MTESTDLSYNYSDADTKLSFTMLSALKGTFTNYGFFFHLATT